MIYPISISNTTRTIEIYDLKIKKYLVNIDERKNLLFAPKGKWSAVQLVENQKVKFDPEDKGFLVQKINENMP